MSKKEIIYLKSKLIEKILSPIFLLFFIFSLLYLANDLFKTLILLPIVIFGLISMSFLIIDSFTSYQINKNENQLFFCLFNKILKIYDINNINNVYFKRLNNIRLIKFYYNNKIKIFFTFSDKLNIFCNLIKECKRKYKKTE